MRTTVAICSLLMAAPLADLRAGEAPPWSFYDMHMLGRWSLAAQPIVEVRLMTGFSIWLDPGVLASDRSSGAWLGGLLLANAAAGSERCSEDHRLPCAVVAGAVGVFVGGVGPFDRLVGAMERYRQEREPEGLLAAATEPPRSLRPDRLARVRAKSCIRPSRSPASSRRVSIRRLGRRW